MLDLFSHDLFIILSLFFADLSLAISVWLFFDMLDRYRSISNDHSGEDGDDDE